MKKLLLIVSFAFSFNCLSAQQYQVGYIPADVTIICDSSILLETTNTQFWFVNDTTTITMVGGYNTVYVENATIYIYVTSQGHHNTFYVKGNSHVGFFGTGTHNTVYMEDGYLRMDSDSNLGYAQNVYLTLVGDNNVIHAVTNSIDFNTGLNNSVANDNPYNGVAFNYTNAPPNPCNQTTGIIEDHISIFVYPNPADGLVTFNFENTGKPKTLAIYDITGRCIEVFNNLQSTKFSYDTKNLTAGMYVYTYSMVNGAVGQGKLVVR